MLIAHFLDRFPLGILFLLTLLLLVTFIEIGYRIGIVKQEKSVKAQVSQVRAIMGATLGLLAFMLAFTFATAQTHYETRVQNMVEEARIAGTAFLLADVLGEPRKSQAKKMLRRYIGDRLELGVLLKANNTAEILALIDVSEDIQRELWKLAIENKMVNSDPGQPRTQQEPFTLAVIGLIDIHVMRKQAALMNRISIVIWLNLYFMAMLAMTIMGYQAGLTGKRSPIATLSLAVAFSAVIMLITDLDRPMMSMFEINNQIMVDLAERMDIGMERDQPSGE